MFRIIISRFVRSCNWTKNYFYQFSMIFSEISQKLEKVMEALQLIAIMLVAIIIKFI